MMTLEVARPTHQFQKYEAVWTIHPGARYRMALLGYVESYDEAGNTYDVRVPEDNTTYRNIPTEFVWRVHPASASLA